MTRLTVHTVGVRTVQTTGAQLIAQARPGDRVTIRVPAAMGRGGIEWRERTGRVMIKSPGHLALDLGGQHGTPGVATAENIVRLRQRVAS